MLSTTRAASGPGKRLHGVNTIGENRPPELTRGSLWKNIWHLSWPTFFIMVFNFFVGLADLYVAGFIGPDVQAAIGFVTQLFFIVIIVANAIGIGTIAMVSRAVGAANVGRAVEIARQSLLFGVAVAVFITAATILYCREIVALAGMPAEIRVVAEEFLRIFAFALGPNYLLIIFNAVFRAAGDVKKPLLTMFFVGLVNIVGRLRPGLRDSALSGDGVPGHRLFDGLVLHGRDAHQRGPAGHETLAGCLYRALAGQPSHHRDGSSTSAGRRSCCRSPGRPGASCSTTSCRGSARAPSRPWPP